MVSTRLQNTRLTYKNWLHSCPLAMKRIWNKSKQTISFTVENPSSLLETHIPKIHLADSRHSLSKSQIVFLQKLKINPWENAGHWNTQIYLKKNKVKIFSNFKTYYKKTIIKAKWYYRRINIQMNGIELKFHKQVFMFLKIHYWSGLLPFILIFKMHNHKRNQTSTFSSYHLPKMS